MFDFMLGNVRHQLDEKDRMRIPAKYREALGGTSYILPGRKVDGNHCCLYIIPYDKFEKVFAKLDTDELYGGDKTKFGQNSASLIFGQCLHAGELTLTHPRTEKSMTFNAPMPENMDKLLEKLRRMQ